MSRPKALNSHRVIVNSHRVIAASPSPDSHYNQQAAVAPKESPRLDLIAAASEYNIGRLTQLNMRLNDTLDRLYGPQPPVASGENSPARGGVVGRLEDHADVIGRALDWFEANIKRLEQLA